MSKWIPALIALAAWGLAPWTPFALPLVLAGAAGFWVLRDRPLLGAVAAVFAGFAQLWWVADAWTLAGHGVPWVLVPLSVWQALPILLAVALAQRLEGGPLLFGWIWAVAQAAADVVAPIPALHATLAAHQPIAIWPAAIGGPALVTGMLAALAALGIEAPRRGAALLGLYLAIGAALGALPPTGRTLRAGVIQPDLHALDARPSLADARQERLLALLHSEEVDLWALPEGAWPHDPGDRPGQRRRTFEQALAGLPPVVTGATVDQSFNSLVAVPWARLDKQVRMPVWERRFLGLGQDRYEAGGGRARMPVGSVVVGGLICYEDVVWRRVQRAAGAEVLVAATNDSWNGPGAGSALHLGITRLVATSTGSWVLRPASNGPSAIVDPWGALAWSAPWVESGPGRVGTATITVGRSLRPGRWALLWDALLVLGLLVWWRR